ncbi:MAG: PKD domain-containing protein [Rhodoferax sp.]|nr:PKD domain-containing protein [Rhodoferax sp.]
MQLIKPSPIAVATLATLLSACGGGKGDDPAPIPAVKVSAIALSKATPQAIAENELQFDGGVCSGGSGDLTASWDFGDKTPASTSNTHTYVTGDASYTVKVTCTDAAGNKGEGKNIFTVAHASMNGFLGKKWSTYTRIPALHPSVYPVAGLSTAGDIHGVGVPSAASGLDVAAMSANFGISNEIGYDKLPTGTDKPPFNDTLEGMRTASIDLAVSPNGRVMAAWMAGTSVWYATKNGLKGVWSVPVKIDVPVLDESIKVVVNDAGAGAIAYCTRTGAQIVTYASQTTQAPVTISKQCGGIDKDEKSLQRYRAFDIAIDNTSSTIYAAGVNDAATAGKSVVTMKSYTSGSGWTAATAVSNELATPPVSLSYSRSPNGNFAILAWNQLGTVAPFKSNVFTRIHASATWGVIKPVQDNFITKDYARPLVAINDSGDAFLAMRLGESNDSGTTFTSKIEVSNYAANATAPAWSQPYQLVRNGSAVQFSATDIAIDKWGTGLITLADGSNPVQVGTFSKTASWSGFSDISPRFPNPKAFHYQTMRALPDGRAILVTSVYDDKTPLTDSTAPISSGYVLLK